MERKELVSENGTASVYRTEDPAVLWWSYQDVVSDAREGRSEACPGKGAVCNRMSAHLFRLLETHGIKTAFVEELTDRDSFMRDAERLPFALVVRNYSAGSFVNRTALPEGSALAAPTVELRLDREGVSYQMINGYDCLALKLAGEAEIETLIKTAFHVNEILCGFFASIGIDLIDCYLEFGRHKEELLLMGTLSPDSMRLWDSQTHEKMDLDRFRRKLGNVGDAYLEVYQGLGIGDVRTLLKKEA